MKWQFTLFKIFNLHGWLLDFQLITKITFQLEGLRQAVLAGYKALTGLDGTPSSLHAAAVTVAVMEDHWAFNAGYGSVLNEVWKLIKKISQMESKKEKRCLKDSRCIENKERIFSSFFRWEKFKWTQLSWTDRISTMEEWCALVGYWTNKSKTSW